MKETLKLALDALENVEHISGSTDWFDDCVAAALAIKEELAKQEGQSNFCPQCEALARELKAIKQEQRSDSEQLGEPVALDVTLDEAAVEMLNAFSSPSPHLNDYSELRLMLGEGHSGYGLYLSLAEYPEEGSELLVNTTPQQRKPLSAYINSAKINANDLPHIVVEKLEKAIEAAHGIAPQGSDK